MPSILVTVDDTPSCTAARDLAAALARRTGASLRGVTGHDLDDIERIEPVPIGGAEYAYAQLRRNEKRAHERRAQIAALPAAFRAALAGQGIDADCVTLGDDVRAALLREIETCDLLVSGRDAAFHCEASTELSALVQYVLAKGARPVVVSGPRAAGAGPVLVAYDGSAPAARALQLAALLGVIGPAGAHVVSVAADGAAAAAIAARAGCYLEGCGLAATLDPRAADGRPDDLLLARAAELDASMLVMGAFGHRGWREALFGSTSSRLMNTADVPLFIHH